MSITLKQIESLAGYYKHTSAHLEGTEILMSDLFEYVTERAGREFCEKRLPKGWRVLMWRDSARPDSIAFTAQAFEVDGASRAAALYAAENIGVSFHADSAAQAYIGVGLKLERISNL